MKTCSHYRILTDTDNNFASNDKYLHVNCAGHSFFAQGGGGRSVRHDYYLLYVYGGSIRVDSPNIENPLEAGDVIIFEHEQPFGYFNISGDFEYYWVHFSGYGVSEVLNQCHLSTNTVFSPGKCESICNYFENLFEAFLIRGELFDVISANKLMGILIEIAKNASDEHKDFKRSYGKINSSMTYIHKNIARPIRVEELAEKEHMSVSRYRSVFTQITGMPPRQYIIHTKLKYACELMRHTEHNISQIGAMVGYDDPRYFCRIYKKYIGTLPSKYRGN